MPSDYPIIQLSDYDRTLGSFDLLTDHGQDGFFAQLYDLHLQIGHTAESSQVVTFLSAIRRLLDNKHLSTRRRDLVLSIFSYWASVKPELWAEGKISMPRVRGGLTDEAGDLWRLCERFSPTSDTLADVEMFLEDRRNIMDGKQLAEGQLDADVIHVVAPEPLELAEDEATRQVVFDSTVRWLRQHLDDTNAKMWFWVRASSGNNPPLVLLAQMLLPYFGTDSRVLDRLECVQAPDKFFLTDYTVWFYSNGPARAFMNERHRNYRLFELKPTVAQQLVNYLYEWLGYCAKGDDLIVPDPSRRLAGLPENRPEDLVSNVIKRRVLTLSTPRAPVPAPVRIDNENGQIAD